MECDFAAACEIAEIALFKHPSELPNGCRIAVKQAAFPAEVFFEISFNGAGNKNVVSTAENNAVRFHAVIRSEICVKNVVKCIIGNGSAFNSRNNAAYAEI